MYLRLKPYSVPPGFTRDIPFGGVVNTQTVTDETDTEKTPKDIMRRDSWQVEFWPCPLHATTVCFMLDLIRVRDRLFRLVHVVFAATTSQL